MGAAQINTDHFIVVNALFEYNKPTSVWDPASGEVVQRPSAQYAFRGNVVTDLDQRDVNKGLHFGEIRKVSAPEPDAPIEGANPTAGRYDGIGAEEFQAMDVEHVVAVMVEQRPSEDRLRELVGDSPAAARAVISAEDRVTDGDPRTTLIDSMQTVIDENDEDDEGDDFGPAQNVPDSNDEDELEEDYSGEEWTKKALKQELDERGVEYAKTATNDVLRGLLVENDEAADEDED